ncbi:hypothetical protein [Pedobacter aquatilis]|uniref:hypothetical protein n=1 Tax=Pedobacter aquatilis TaxID=351343 RepID=UPI0029314AAE|nr:hypothetical protein [Pedobacter aquatilis]
MNATQFLTYQKFIDKSLAYELKEILATHKIESVYEDASTHFDHSFANNQSNNEYLIKIKSADFERADKILAALSANDQHTVDPEHYLFDFTDDELRDVLLKSDEWSKYDYILAQKILQERGHIIDKGTIDNLKMQRIEELSKPEKSQISSIIAGYIFALLGGLIAIFIGWHLFSHQKTLPNGVRTYGYSEYDRKHGKIIAIIGTLSAIVWITFRFIDTYY